MINPYVKLRNHACLHLVLLLPILMDFIILPAQLLEGDQLVPFLIQPLSRSAYIWSSKEWNPLSPPWWPPPEILMSHSSPRAHSKKQGWGILTANSKGVISSVWIYFPLNHKTFIIISLARTQESSAFALHQHNLPLSSSLSSGPKDTKGGLNSWTYWFEACLYKKDNHTFLHPRKDEPNNSHHLLLTHSSPVLSTYLLN